MTYKEYAQNIVKGCGRKLIQFPFVASADNCGEINPDNLQIELCLKCQRARQTAIDLGKMWLKFIEDPLMSCKHFKDKVKYDYCGLCSDCIYETKTDIQEGLEILGDKK